MIKVHVWEEIGVLFRSEGMLMYKEGDWEREREGGGGDNEKIEREERMVKIEESRSKD